MPGTPLTIPAVLTLLGETPQRIDALTVALTPEQARTPPAPDEWSVNGILAHLRSCADVWGDCIATILAEDRPTIRAVNPTAWIERTDYREQGFRPSFDAFRAQRADLLVVLKALPPDDWLRSATVTGAGAPLQRTVLFYARWLARHERTHIRPIRTTVMTVSRS